MRARVCACGAGRRADGDGGARGSVCGDDGDDGTAAASVGRASAGVAAGDGGDATAGGSSADDDHQDGGLEWDGAGESDTASEPGATVDEAMPPPSEIGFKRVRSETVEPDAPGASAADAGAEGA